MLFSENTDEMEKMVNELNRDGMKVGVGINMEQTKTVFKQAALPKDVKIYGRRLTAVKKLNIWIKL